jgi:hypothetical protein
LAIAHIVCGLTSVPEPTRDWGFSLVFFDLVVFIKFSRGSSRTVRQLGSKSHGCDIAAFSAASDGFTEQIDQPRIAVWIFLKSAKLYLTGVLKVGVRHFHPASNARKGCRTNR